MNLLFTNLVLALVWAAVTASFSPGNLLFGFVLGFVSLWLVRHRFKRRDFNRPRKLLMLAGLFLVELCLSAFRVARDTLRPRMIFRPAIIAVPLDLKSDVEILLLANLISLTPGTLSVDVSADRTTLYVHAMHVDDPQHLRDEIKSGFERAIREAFA